MLQYADFGRREGFNQALRHIVRVTSLIETVSKGANLADIVHNLLLQKAVEAKQVLPIVSVILRDKLNLPYACLNLPCGVGQEALTGRVTETCKRWKAVDIVCAYSHPYMGEILINPANKEHWALVEELKQNEFITIYARMLSNKASVEKAKQALNAFLQLLLSKKSPETLTDPAFLSKQAYSPKLAEPQKPKPTSTVSAPSMRQGENMSMTPRYSVQVTNELFHNGNVEAWKNIIESYQEVYSNCRVIVYHEGELVQDLNSLFKWGKVKRDGVIFFQIAGSEIKAVRRLQKYLHEAASSRFEVFMKHDVNRSLQLF